jgi:hypothetical protein
VLLDIARKFGWNFERMLWIYKTAQCVAWSRMASDFVASLCLVSERLNGLIFIRMRMTVINYQRFLESSKKTAVAWKCKAD